ncbi:MAG: glutamyl-tRNA reductase [Sedimentisphaerales bacterium]|nr:glutamyl-tRNA reductase [Sedimentisphaerales bacterium]
MELVLHSVTYHDCPVEQREKVSLEEGQQHDMLGALMGQQGIGEAAILQTCNRTEVYLYAQKSIDWRQPVSKLMGRISPDAGQTWGKYCKQKRGIDVARHLFGVTAGLDSQMLGENQILSQVKAAYTESIECRASRFIFHRLFHTAFRVGKAVRTQTDINCGAVSISLAAVELAKEKLNLWSSAAMVIGAGENAEIAARYLVKGGIGSLIIANRSRDNAKAMCKRLGAGRVITLGGIARSLKEVDLVIASTGATQPVITFKDAKAVLQKRRKPLLMIDIAVPRDIDERISRFDCITIVNIDDLDRRITANREKRSSEIPKAEKIVDDFTNKFACWLDSLSVVPVVAQLTQKAMEMARAEAKRYAKDFGDKNAEKLETFAESLARKLLHGPVSFLKDTGDEDPTTQQLRALDLVNKMFLLDNENEQ